MTYGETVARLRRGAPMESSSSSGDEAAELDRYREPVFVWSETSIPGAGVAWGPSAEPLVIDGHPVTVDATLYFWETTPDIKREDRVRVRGEVYEVVGDPSEWRNPFTGWNAGLVVNLVRGEGS